MAEWVQAVRVAIAVTCMLLVVIFIAETHWKAAFFQGEVSMLKQCRNGHPACMVPHTHSDTPKQDNPVIET